MVRKSVLFVWLSVGLLTQAGCRDEEATPTPEDLSPTPTDSSPVEETSTPAGDDDATDSGIIPTPTAIPNYLTNIQISPTSMTLDTASSFTFNVRGTMRFGEVVDVVVEAWNSSDPAVAAVDIDGTLHPLTAGTTTISATAEGVTSNVAEIQVVDSGNIQLRVINPDTGAAIPGAHVYVGMDELVNGYTDENGALTLSGDFSGPLSVSATAADHHIVTVQNTISRNLTLPLRSLKATLKGRFSGSTDFSQMGNLPPNSIRVGIMTRSFYGNPMSIDTSAIIGPNRTLTVCGYDIGIPSNIVGQTNCGDSEEDITKMKQFRVPSPENLYDTYMLAGDVTAGTVFGWIDDPDIFYNLGVMMSGLPDMYEYSYYFGQDVPVTALQDNNTVIASPSGVTNAPMTIEIPGLPSGTSSDYLPLALVVADMGERGFLPIGMNGGEPGHNATVFYPGIFNDYPLYGLIMDGRTGVGNPDDEAYSIVMGQLKDGEDTVKTPDFLEFVDWDASQTDYSTGRFTMFGVQTADVYISMVSVQYPATFDTNYDGKVTEKDYYWRYWDVYQSNEELTTQLPTIAPEEALDLSGAKRVDWEFYAYDNGDLTFLDFTGSPERTVADARQDLVRTSRNKVYKMNEGGE